jgi:hypothetical protein
MRMPFGKYRGRGLEQVPDDYLVWVLDNCRDLQPTLRHLIEVRLGLLDEPRQATRSPDWQVVLQQWYRQLTLDYHPDRGGSTEAMQAINDAYERLREELGLSHS